MWGNDDFQKDVEKLKYRKRVREAAEFQEKIDKLVSFLLYIVLPIVLFLVFAMFMSFMQSLLGLDGDTKTTGESSAERPAASSPEVSGTAATPEVQGGTLIEPERAGNSQTVVDISSLPESANPTLCLNVISKALATAGRGWEQEVSPEIAVQCQREMAIQRQRDRAQ